MVSTSLSDWGVTTQYQNSFGSYYDDHGNSQPPVYSWSNGTLHAYLVNTQGKLPTTSREDQDNTIGSVSRLIGLIPVNVAVSDGINSMTLSFKVTQGCTVGQSTSGSNPTTLEFFGGGPFEIQIAVQ